MSIILYEMVWYTQEESSIMDYIQIIDCLNKYSLVLRCMTNHYDSNELLSL